MDWIYIVLPVSFLAFTASFFVFTRGQAGHPNLIRYWTPLYAVMIGCQAQGILLWVRSSRRWLAAAGMAFVPVYFGVMYIGIPEVHADRATDEELLKPGYSYFYFTGNLIAFYEMPVDQALLSDLDVSRSYDGQRDLFEGICVGIGALTGYDVSGHLELARDYSADRRIMVYRGMGFGAGLAGLKWEDPPGGLPDVGADERIWIRSGEKRLVEQVGRAKFIDRYRDRVKDFRALPDSVDAKP